MTPPLSVGEYSRRPVHPVVGGTVRVGLAEAAATVTTGGVGVLAVDGPPSVDWASLVDRLSAALDRQGVAVRTLDVRDDLPDWGDVLERTREGHLRDDPDFEYLSTGSMATFVGDHRAVPSAPAPAGLVLVFGPGASLRPHDRLWYAALSKHDTVAAVSAGASNLGQRPGREGTLRRLRFVDWPVQDRHVADIVGDVDLLLDLGADVTTALEGDGLRASLSSLGAAPFRTLPRVSPGVWGGQWLRGVLDIPSEGPNLAWSWELIAPEAGILLGDDHGEVEVGFEWLMAHAGPQVVGADVAERFGGSFPIRVDYLDTMRGQNLSVHLHPRDRYMRDVFGWDYTQHETYYLMDTSAGSRVFLGLRDDVDVGELRTALEESAECGAPFDADRWINSEPARRHQLYTVPAGTPHGSSAGNVVLEVSATPYLYSLRLHDWGRLDLDGTPRPLHIDHALRNIDGTRRAARVADELAPAPRVLVETDEFTEWLLCDHPQLFFDVRRLDFADRARNDTDGRFVVCNLVDGEQVELVTMAGRHRLAYGETMLVPAGVGPHRFERVGRGPCKVLLASVRPARMDA